MAITLNALRQFVAGTLDESAINELKDAADGYDLDSEEVTDEEMQEAASIGMPLIIQGEVMGDICESLEEATETAYAHLSSYLVGQGYISEAAAMPSNPKINYVRLNKQATLKRLEMLYVLYLARKNNDKNYKKYKLACALKKTNRDAMKKKYGTKAAAMAKKHYAATRGGKVKATVAAAKDKAAK